MILYRNVGDGTRDRETCFRNFRVLWIAIFLNAKSRVKADILQLLAGDAAEILTVQLAFYIGTFGIREDVEVDIFHLFTCYLS